MTATLLRVHLPTPAVTRRGRARPHSGAADGIAGIVVSVACLQP